MDQSSVTLTGVLENAMEQIPISLENFHFTEDMFLKSFGKDKWGSYDYHGQMMPDGRFYMYKSYPTVPAINPKTLAGSITPEGNLAGYAYEGKNPPNSLHVTPTGTFFIEAKFNQWTGVRSNSSGTSFPFSLNLRALDHGQLFGMGIKNGFVYLILGKLSLEEGSVFINEIWLPAGPGLTKTYTHYHGRFSAQGMRTVMTGSIELRYRNTFAPTDVAEKGEFSLTFDAEAITPQLHHPQNQPVQMPYLQNPPNPYSMQYAQLIQPMMPMNYAPQNLYHGLQPQFQGALPPLHENGIAPSKRNIKRVSFSAGELIPKQN